MNFTPLDCFLFKSYSFSLFVNQHFLLKAKQYSLCVYSAVSCSAVGLGLRPALAAVSEAAVHMGLQ